MRTILLTVILFSFTALRAQTFIPGFGYSYMPAQRFTNNIFANDSLPKKQWSFSRYAGISTSFAFFNGGNATILSAPIGLQLNRRLNNNLYAFANIAVAPSYINFNHSFISATSNKMNPGSIFSRQNSLGIYSSASMGLMYINDDRTFSISGSISVERSSMPLLPAYSNNASRPMPFNTVKK